MQRMGWAALSLLCLATAVPAQEPPTAEPSPPAAAQAPAPLSPPNLANISKLIPGEITAQIRDYALQAYMGGLSDRELELLKVRPQDCTPSAFCDGTELGRIGALAGVILNDRAKGSTAASATWSSITAGLTLITATFVAWIAYQQWRTARQKLAFDLFARRVAVYDKVVQAATKVIGPGRPEDNEPYRLLHTARSEAQFLFGPEVSEHIHGVIKAVAALDFAHNMMEAEGINGKAAGDTKDYPQMSYDAIMVVESAEQNLAALLATYAGFTEGLPSTLWHSIATVFRRRNH